MSDYLINKRLKELCNNTYLTNEQNMQLFTEYQQERQKGVDIENIEARTLLILGNQKIIYFILRSKFGLEGRVEDMDEFGVAQIGLVKSVDTYNSDSGAKFLTYATRVIMNEILMYYRNINSVRNYANKTQIYLEDYITDSISDDSPIMVKDVIRDEYDFVEDVMDNDLIERIIKNLKYLLPNEAYSVIHYYGLFGNDPDKQKDIAPKLKVARSDISRCLTKGLQKLKVLLLNEHDLTDDEKLLKYKLLHKGAQNDLDNVL